MRILVTGCACFIGSNLCEQLLNKCHDVICLDNFFTGSKDTLGLLRKTAAYFAARISKG